MSPITFQPPLGSHHTLSIPSHLFHLTSTSSNPSGGIDIRLIATDLNGLNETDRVEVWTDAPGLGGPGGWRAVALERVSGSDDPVAKDGNDVLEGFENSPLLELCAKTTASPATSSSFSPSCTPYMLATLSIPIRPSSSPSYTFGYTYRISYPDGNVWWLGNEGGNGSITVTFVGDAGEGEGGGGEKVGEGAGRVWSGEGGIGVEDVERGSDRWEGFTIENGKYTSSPSIQPITESTTSSALLAYLYPSSTSSPPKGLTAVLPPSTSALSLAPSTSSTSLSISSAGPSLSSRSADGKEQEGGNKAFVVSGEELANLLAGLTQSSSLLKGLKSVPTTSSTATHHKAFLSTSSTGSYPDHVLVYAAGQAASTVGGLHQVGLHLPSEVLAGHFGGKLAVWSEKLMKAVLLDGPAETETVEAKLRLQMDEGTAELDLIKLMEISLSGSEGKPGASSWIGAVSKGVKLAFHPASKRDETYEEEVEEWIMPEVVEPVQKQQEEPVAEVENDGKDAEGARSAEMDKAVTDGASAEHVSATLDERRTQGTAEAEIEHPREDNAATSSVSGTDPGTADLADEAEDRLISGPNEPTSQQSTSTGALWIVLSFFHSLWIKSGLSWLLQSLAGGGKTIEEGGDRSDEAVDYASEAESQGYHSGEEESIEAPVQPRTPSPASDKAEQVEADENTPLLSGTSTLVNSPQQKIKSTFGEIATALKSEPEPELVKEVKPEPKSEPVKQIKPEPIMTKVMKTRSRTVGIPAFVEITTTEAGETRLITSAEKDTLKIEDWEYSADVDYALQDASSGLYILTITAGKGQGRFKLLRA